MSIPGIGLIIFSCVILTWMPSVNCFSGFKAFQNLFKTIWLAFSHTLGTWAQHKSFAICLGLAKTDLFFCLAFLFSLGCSHFTDTFTRWFKLLRAPKPFLLDNLVPQKDSEKLLTFHSNLAILSPVPHGSNEHSPFL